MKNTSPKQLEMRALSILNRLTKGTFHEDSLVELKRHLPADDYKVARRIAGHCNASGGETVIWIIGADENDGVVGWNAEDSAELLPRIWSHFSGIRPECTDISFEYNGSSCTALAFSADNAPYLIKNPLFGSGPGAIENEIPWRNGTSVRTATRDQVIRLLLDRTSAPDIELFRGQVHRSNFVSASKTPEPGLVDLIVDLEFYAMPRDNQPVVIPTHRISASLSDQGKEHMADKFHSFNFLSEEARRRQAQALIERSRNGGPVFPLPPPEDSVRFTGTEVVLTRPAHVHMRASVSFLESVWDAWDYFKLDVTLRIGVDQVPLLISVPSLRKVKAA